MPPLGRVGKAPDQYFVSHQGDPDLPWYVYIVDDRSGCTGGFFLYWSQSPSFETEPLFDEWAENADALSGWDLSDFEWLPEGPMPPGLASA